MKDSDWQRCMCVVKERKRKRNGTNERKEKSKEFNKIGKRKTNEKAFLTF